jgi:hypothetical protein
MAGNEIMSTPHTDFEVELTRDVTAFGVLEGNAEAYVRGVGREALWFLRQVRAKRRTRLPRSIMTRHGAVELEEISALRPELPTSDEASPVRALSFQIGESALPVRSTKRRPA